MGLAPDPASFFDEMYPRVHRFLSAATGADRGDVEDLAQETLLEAWRSRDRFRGDASPLTWVLGIAKNRARLRRRERGVEGQAERALRAIASLRTEEVPVDLVQGEEMKRRVRQALEALDPSYAEVLMQRYYEGLSVRAIAERRGEGEKAVESRLHRAKEAFRECLERGVDDDRRE
ncbi:MAG TPA: RNA polymerase sigma factor [Planctomycetota bacterium]|nr:RNA polymerase sigma factor [Planctomycetota bacterium]